MSINPNAVMTPGPSCPSCGEPITGYYCVMLCDRCLDARIEYKPCFSCGTMAKIHPRSSRVYGDKPWEENKWRYWCRDCVGPQGLTMPRMWQGDYA